MAAITKGRTGSERAVNRDKRPLQAVHVYKGGLCAVNAAGYYGPATGSANEVVVGVFYEEVDNSAGAAGAKSADVLFRPERCIRLVDNDTGTPVTIAKRERLVAIIDDHTVSGGAPATGTGVRCYDVTTEGVWVEFSGKV
jgi:hypothetical protein